MTLVIKPRDGVVVSRDGVVWSRDLFAILRVNWRYFVQNSCGLIDLLDLPWIHLINSAAWRPAAGIPRSQRAGVSAALQGAAAVVAGARREHIGSDNGSDNNIGAAKTTYTTNKECSQRR